MLGVIQDTFKGILTPKTWSKNKKLKMLREAIADALWGAAEAGYGTNLVDLEYNSKDYDLLSRIKDNVYTFAAYKNYQTMQSLGDLLTDDEGNIRTYQEFRKVALTGVHANYNELWLTAEYNTTFASAQNAARWVRFEENRDLFPNLTYRTQGDANVREAHRKLAGLTRPIDDEIWDTIAPPKVFQCRCFLEPQDADAELTPDAQLREIPALPEKSPFRGNPGKTGRIFNEDHDYFHVDVNDEVRNQIRDLQ